ncbi:MAG: hypothetical protein AAGA92_14480 [Planctomycetota bacterium]
MAAPQRMHWSALLWPGFAQAWGRGSWAGLAVAVGFTWVGCVLLVATVVYSGWIDADARNLGAAALVVVWVLALAESRTQWRRAAMALVSEAAREDPAARCERLFGEAQRLYLAGDWDATEARLRDLLATDAKDIEGRLLLATLLRHRERTDEALVELDRLERLEAADAWRDEIARERSALYEQLTQTETDNEEDHADDGVVAIETAREEHGHPETENDETEPGDYRAAA